MSAKLAVALLFPGCLFAQFGGRSNGITLNGEVRTAHTRDLDHLFVDLKPVDASAPGGRATTDSDGHFTFDNIAPGSYSLRVLPQPGADPIYETPVQVNAFTGPLTVEIPSRPESQPITGVVSVQQLRHPPSKKAVQAFNQAEQYSHSHDTAKAIEKLELAIQLAPDFREAHLNLGAQYLRQGRYQEAMTHLQTSLEIGPPDSKAYLNLAFCYVKLQQYADAASYAKKALALDPGNTPAQVILRALSAHAN